jgi:pimeloyl-ACP methyl ester carboxylesterase
MKTSTIVILHGWGLSGERFRGLSDELSSLGYTVYTPDLPGFGKSEIPTKALYLVDYAEFLQSFLLQHAINNPILLGHSFGGRVSLKFTQMYPNKVKALILTGAPGVTPVPKRKLAVFVAVAKIGNFCLSIWPLNRMKDSVRQWYYYAVGARDFYRANGVMREIFKHIVQEDLMKPMQSVQSPTALIWGADDIITPFWIAEKMKTIIRGSVLISIPDSDHGVSYKQPTTFAKYVDEYLKTVC